MYIEVNKIEYIWLNCQLGGLFQYEQAKTILEIEKTIDFRFFIFLVLCASFFWLTTWYIPCCFCTCNKILNFFFIFFFDLWLLQGLFCAWCNRAFLDYFLAHLEKSCYRVTKLIIVYFVVFYRIYFTYFLFTYRYNETTKEEWQVDKFSKM